MKNKILISSGAGLLLITIFFVGQFYDPEDGDRHFFIKYKPTLQQFFYSPAAYHRYQPTKLTPGEEIDELAFQEFVAARYALKPLNFSSFFPALLIEGTLTLLVCGFFSLYTRRTIKNWQVIVQFLVNIIITTFVLAYISLADNQVTTLISCLVIITINLITIMILTKGSAITREG